MINKYWIFVFLSMVVMPIIPRAENSSKQYSVKTKIVKSQTYFLNYSVFNTDLFYGSCGPCNDNSWGCLSSFYIKKYRNNLAINDKVVFYIVPSGLYTTEDTNKNIRSFKSAINKNYIEYKNNRVKVFLLEPEIVFSRSYDYYKPIYWFSLLSDNNKKIHMYCVPTQGSYDVAVYGTKHAYPIAILLDENNYIISILDNVKDKKDIFDIFNIK